MLVWFWCSECERAFYVNLPKGSPMDMATADYLEEPEECPFELCPSGHIWLWWKHRATNTDYPEIPLYGVRYPLYPDEDDYDRVLWIHRFVKSLG